jgi:hypothetical protein
MKFSLACKCGAAWKGEVPRGPFAAIRALWDEVHFGVGHGDTTPKAARRARMKSEGK